VENKKRKNLAADAVNAKINQGTVVAEVAKRENLAAVDES
jgi:hypothetical protein